MIRKRIINSSLIPIVPAVFLNAQITVENNKNFAIFHSKFLAEYALGRTIKSDARLETPTSKELESFENVITRFLNIPKRPHKLIYEKLSEYKYQCVVVVQSSNRYLHVSALQSPRLNWRANIVTTNDGDEAAWRAVFDLKKSKIIHFSVNGPTVYTD